MRGFLVAVVSVVVLSGCVSVGALNSKMSAWQGRSADELVAEWGPPQQVMQAAENPADKILIYTLERTWTDPGYVSTTRTPYAYRGIQDASVTTYMPPAQSGYTAYRMFWVHPDGRIYNWAWKGT